MRLEEGGGEVQGEGEMVISCYGIVGYITLATSESSRAEERSDDGEMGPSDRREREETERSEKAPQARGAERLRAERVHVRRRRELPEAVVGWPSICLVERSEHMGAAGEKPRGHRRMAEHRSGRVRKRPSIVIIGLRPQNTPCKMQRIAEENAVQYVKQTSARVLESGPQ